MKKIYFLFVVVALLFAGKFYIEHKYKESLDKTFAFSPVAASYENVTLGFDGSLSIHGLKMDLPNDAGTVKIKKIKAVSSDPLLFLNQNAFKIITFNWIQLKVEDFFIDLNLSTSEVLELCNSSSAIYALAEQRGIKANLVVDVNFKDQQNSKLTINYKDKFGYANAIATFSYTKLINSFSANGFLPIHEVIVEESIDLDYAAQANQHCADELDVSVEHYLNEIASSPEFFYNSFGYNLGGEANLALAEYVQGGKVLRVKSVPSDFLKKTRSLQLYSAENIARWLNLTVTLNDKPVAIGFNSQQGFKRNSNIIQNDDVESDVNVEKAEAGEVKKDKPSYKETAVSTLSNYLYKPVKVWRKGGKSVVKGRIVKYQDKIAFVEVRQFGGRSVYEIPINDIKKLHVLR